MNVPWWQARLIILVLSVFFILTALAFAAPEPQVSVVAGGLVMLGTESDGAVEPMARIMAQWNIAGLERALKGRVIADLTALPGDSLGLESPESWNALEMSGALSYKPAHDVAAAGYCEVGFASRMPHGVVKPRTSAPLWSSCGILFEARRGWIQAGVGPDERLGHGWTFAATVSGSVRVFSVGQRKRTGMDLLVSAILGLEEAYGTRQRTNVIRAASGVSWK